MIDDDAPDYGEDMRHLADELRQRGKDGDLERPARSFEPVWLPAERELKGRVSQTFLRHFNGCPRSGFLYALYKGEAQTVPMVRGTALHDALERCVRAALDAGEKTVPPELAKAVIDEVLEEHPVPIEEHDYLRECVYRWAEQTELGDVVALETMFVLDILGWQVRAKVDYAELRGRRLWVRDYKSARGLPSYEEVSRKRPEDGTLAAKNFQLVLYALLMVFGVPVTVGTGPDGERVETPAAQPMFRGLQGVDLEFLFPGVEDREGQMVRRELSLTPLELEEYRASLVSLVARVQKAEAGGQWPAVTSDGACSECPARPRCPIPAELRTFAGRINTPEEAAEALEQLWQEKAQHAARRKEIKLVVKDFPGQVVLWGKDKASRFEPVTKTSLNRDGLMSAALEAAQYGTPFDAAAFTTSRTHTEFKDVTLTSDELAAQAGSNDSTQEGSA